MDIFTRKISEAPLPQEILAIAEGLISNSDNVITLSELKKEEDAE